MRWPTRPWLIALLRNRYVMWAIALVVLFLIWLGTYVPTGPPPH